MNYVDIYLKSLLQHCNENEVRWKCLIALQKTQNTQMRNK